MNKQGFIHLRVTIYVVNMNKWQIPGSRAQKRNSFSKGFSRNEKKHLHTRNHRFSGWTAIYMMDLSSIFCPSVEKKKMNMGHLCSTIVNPILASLGQRYTMIHENNAKYVIHFRKIYIRYLEPKWPLFLIFDRKRSCFEGLTFKNRGHWSSGYIQIYM